MGKGMHDSRNSLRAFVKLRTGLPIGAKGSLQASLVKAFGARSPAGFWQYWNPIFGFYLGRYIFTPVKRFCPPAIALLTTFIACGALHDFVTFLVRGYTHFLFTAWFFWLGVGVLLAHTAKLSFSRFGFWVRASCHAATILSCLALARVLQWAWI